MIKARVNVRTLAEFALEGGDITPSAMAGQRMLDGIRGHQALQAEYPAGYRAEVAMSITTQVENVVLTVHGRADGVFSKEGVACVEEIKTTAGDVTALTEGYPVHWAQAQIYAHILCRKNGEPRCRVMLTYYNVSSTSRTSFTREYTADELSKLFEEYTAPYVRWTAALTSDATLRRESWRTLKFPFPTYRQGQRDMAANVYVALRDGQKLLVQAPTGIGKTAAALFPAIKAMGEGLIATTFYLTARTTARTVAQASIEGMRAQGLTARDVTITAKDKVCVSPEAGCDPGLCPRARGYFDRRRLALYEALDMQAFKREAIEALAEKHSLCPYELSLDLSEIADIIICDYNYAFDPQVKLRRYFLDKGNYALLIDEAHNLCDRAREMLSCEVAMRPIARLKREVSQLKGAKHPLTLALAGVVKALKGLALFLPDEPATHQQPDALAAAMEKFAEEALPCLEESAPYQGALVDQFYIAQSVAKVIEQFDDKRIVLIQGEDVRSLTVKLWCQDPSEYLRSCMARVRGSVLFSATLTPLGYYADLLGVSEREGDAMMSIISPFPPERQLTVRMPLGTRFRQRAETAHQVAGAIIKLARAKVGNYLACFPSHAYLNQTLAYLHAQAGDIKLMAQRAAMSETEREAFLAAFVDNPTHTMIALITMGGVFAEGVDLPGDRLSGVAIVGVCLPQICLERDVLRAYYDDRFEDGYAFSYVYPGMGKVMQAAGRVIRSETDAGVVLLMDDRYAHQPYPELMPEHWHVQDARDEAQLGKMLGAFWAELALSLGGTQWPG